jgi:hydroxyquinol 1,2-dioxygenase
VRDFDEHSITDAVLASLAGATSARARRIGEALVRHLHDFVREIEPTEAEWAAAIDFLTRTGHLSGDKRQEFILLSDALGVSMLVDAINHRQPAGATETTVLGPFYAADAAEVPLGADLAAGLSGVPMIVTGSVSAVGGGRIAGAVVDTWHADAEGYYDVQRPGGPTAMRARLRTDSEGRFWFWSIRPAAYPIPADGPVGQMLKAQGRHPYRPAHVHFLIQAPGVKTLVTHVFAEGDRYLDSDVVFGVKSSLIRRYEERPPGTAPDGRAMSRPYVHLHYDFALEAEPRAG